MLNIMELKQTLNLFDATSIGIGAIIGAGIFVVLGLTTGYAGPSVIISMIIAGVVASFTAFSFAELGSAIPREGGAYAYAYELISPFVAFVVGCLWMFAQVVAGAAINLGFAGYFVTIFPVSVLLTNLIGLSRVSFAMARDGQTPKTAAKISSRLGTPYISILIMGAMTVSVAARFRFEANSSNDKFRDFIYACRRKPFSNKP